MQQKGEGNTSKRKMIIPFFRSPIVKATSGYYKCEKKMFNSIICQLYLFNTVIILSAMCSAYSVFLPLFAEEFHKGR